MKTTTTIRVDVDTHRRIQVVHERTGKPMMEVVREAVSTLDRLRLAAQVTEELAVLRADPTAWAAYLDEADALPVSDGLT